IEYRYAEGRLDRLPSLAAELIGLPVALLVAPGVCEAAAAKKATATIPIVFGSGLDPVQLGLVASFNRPGGNATGWHAFGTEINPKHLELLREILPQPGLIAFLVVRRTKRRRSISARWKQPPRRSDSPSWFCMAATRMKSTRHSRQWPNARSAVFFTVRPRISR